MQQENPSALTDAKVPENAPAVRGRRILVTAFRSYALVGVLVVLVLGFSLALPDTFATARNAASIISTQTIDLVLVLGLLFPLSAGDFDLSLSANMVLSATVMTLAINDWHAPLALAVLLALAVGIGVGLINASLIVLAGMSAFIVTLASQTLCSGIALGLTDEQVLVANPTALSTITNTNVIWNGFPISAVYALILAGLVWYMLECTALGRYLRVTGTARRAGSLSGIPTTKLRIFAFTFAGLFASLAGIILLGSVGSVDATSSSAFLLGPYAAAFLGTATIRLGFFNVPGALVAIYIIVVGTTGLELYGAADWAESIFQGIALLIGLTLARLTSGSAQGVFGHGQFDV
jgi:ribose transport system permease protein